MVGGFYSSRVAHTVATVGSYLFVGLLAMCSAQAQQLSIRRYGVSDGLAHGSVHSIHQDRKGYIWIGTREGLSRFDGYRFTNYGVRDGLGHPFVNSVAEDGKGRIWVGTNGAGVARLMDEFQPSLTSSDGVAKPAKRKFQTFPVGNSPESNRVNAILIDSEDKLWCATDGGLYRAASASPPEPQFELVVPHKPVAHGMTAFSDSRGRLWFAIVSELIEVAHGRINTYGVADHIGQFAVAGVTEDPTGKLFAANSRDLFEFVSPRDPDARGTWRRLTVFDNFRNFPFFKSSVAASAFHSVAGSSELGISAMVADSEGRLWIGTERGLITVKDRKPALYTESEGLSFNIILTLQGDRDGNLWIGTGGGGICKLSGELFTSFKESNGLQEQSVSRIVVSRTGHIYASTPHAGFAEIKEGRAMPVQGSQNPRFSGAGPRLLQDRHGDWWIGTQNGLYRFRGPELQLSHGKKFTTANGIPEKMVQSINEDAKGAIWVSLGSQGLYYSDPAKENSSFHELSEARSIFSSVSCAVGDLSGALWLGMNGVLAKLIENRITRLEPTAGLPETDPRALFVDSRGWLWVGLRYKGVSMTKEPFNAKPTFVNYSTENGLSSDTVWSITEDNYGRMYFGTGRGLDRLDPSTRSIRYFSAADGLAGDEVNYCVKDGLGNIWIAMSEGVSKLNPHAERVFDRPPPIYVSRIQIAGEDLDIPETGVELMPALELAPSNNNLLIEFVGLDFAGERELKYQYKLEGVDKDWGPATDQRSANYAHLSPGSYRFLVNAVNELGIRSPHPAVVEFRILRPVWQRWWFVTPAAILMAVMIYAAHRFRVGRIVALERVRTRIATDLHDDIGSSLSKIAILSEVARQRSNGEDSRLNESLSQIANASRELVDAMSDIVWAINPRRDRLRDLTQRMRQFASDFFTAREIAFHFSAPPEEQNVKLDANTRREIFLIYKECVNNMVRHAKCSRANIEFRVEADALFLRMNDDGRGFEGSPRSNGHGLASMSERARKMGGEVQIASSVGSGTSVTLRVPLRQHSWLRGFSDLLK